MGRVRGWIKHENRESDPMSPIGRGGVSMNFCGYEVRERGRKGNINILLYIFLDRDRDGDRDGDLKDLERESFFVGRINYWILLGLGLLRMWPDLDRV